MAKVWIPSLLRSFTGGKQQVLAAGATVGEVIATLDGQYPGIRARLCEGERLQSGIAVAVDGVFATSGLLQTVQPDSELHITPAIGGGASGCYSISIASSPRSTS